MVEALLFPPDADVIPPQTDYIEYRMAQQSKAKHAE
jgi:hypothetical protein